MYIFYIISLLGGYIFYKIRFLIFFKCLYCYSFLKIKCNKLLRSPTYINNNYDANFFICDKYIIIIDNISNIKCNYNFLEIEYEDKYKKFTIDISDKNKSNSFMITNNNILNYEFIKWYINKYYNYTISNNYKVNIIDHDANIIELSEKNSITLKKDKYIVNKENAS